MKLLDFYTSLLADCHIVDEHGEGMLSARFNDQIIPLTVSKKQLCLPTPEILKGGKWDQRIVFHPLGEKLTRGESEVIKATKDYIALRITVVISTLLKELSHIAASPALHKGMEPKAKEFLKSVSEFDEKTYKTLDKILASCSKDPSRRLVNFYLKHGGKGSSDAIRSCIVSFPIMDEFENDEPEVFGVKMPRKKDKELIHKLLEYVLGNAEERELYSCGSRNMEAPFFHSLATSFYKLGHRLQTLVAKHRKHLENADELSFGLQWAEQLDNFALYRGLVPSLEGNEGEVIDKGESTGQKPNLQEQAKAVFGRDARPRQEATLDDLLTDEAKAAQPQPQSRPLTQREQPQQSDSTDARAFLDRLTRRDPQPEELWGNQRRTSGFLRNDFLQDRSQNDRFDTSRSRWDGPQRNILRNTRQRGGGGEFI